MESNDSQDRRGNRTRQKNKRGNSKVESNDSPEIRDRGETSDIPGLPSGAHRVAFGFLSSKFLYKHCTSVSSVSTLGKFTTQFRSQNLAPR